MHPAPWQRWTVKPCSLVEASVHVRSTVDVPVALAVTPVGAAGGLGGGGGAPRAPMTVASKLPAPA